MEKPLLKTVHITEELLANPLNSNVTLVVGTYEEDPIDTQKLADGGGGGCPTPGPGQYGEYIKVNGECVWVPAT